MEKICNESTPIRSTLEELQIGDVARFPKNRLTSIRSTASTYGFEKDKVFSANIDRETGTIKVTRVS